MPSFFLADIYIFRGKHFEVMFHLLSGKFLCLGKKRLKIGAIYKKLARKLAEKDRKIVAQ